MYRRKRRDWSCGLIIPHFTVHHNGVSNCILIFWGLKSELVFTVDFPHSHTDIVSRLFCFCAVHRVKIDVSDELYCALSSLSISFIHSRVIGSQFELPLCLLWAHFALTECGRLMAMSSQGRLASASMSALNSLHQFPPVLRSPTCTHKRQNKVGERQEWKGIKVKKSDGGEMETKKQRIREVVTCW